MKLLFSCLLLSITTFADIHVHVLLQELSLQDSITIKFSSSTLLIKTTSHEYLFDKAQPTFELVIKQGKTYINKKQHDFSTSLIVESATNAIAVNGTVYQGRFHIVLFNNNVCIINKIKLEDYVYSVLHTESWPTWSRETHKLMAIVCRSYAVHKIVEAKRKKLPYHIKSSNKHQTYSGVQTKTILKDAVVETTGTIMAHNGQPVLAMFDICCGGIIPAYIKWLHHKSAPYLGRTYPCTYCKDLSVFTWQTTIHKNDLLTLLQQHIRSLKMITEFKITKKDKAGLPEQLVVKDGKKTFFLEGKKLYSLVKNIKSYCYEITKNGDLYTISGKGFGHHTGLCQWGANEMIKQGYHYKDILSFFYPDIKFVKLTQKKTS